MPILGQYRTINYHTSQVTHGIIRTEEYDEADDVFFIKLGYTPSMVKLYPANLAGDLILGRMVLYSHDTDMLLDDVDIIVNDVVELVESGFTINKTAMAVCHATIDGLIFEAHGPYPEDSVDPTLHPQAMPNQQMGDGYPPYEEPQL